MRKIYTAPLLVFLYVCVNAQKKEPLSVSTSIQKVTLFLSGAQVERSGKVAMSPGKHNLLFPGISPSIDVKSIQLKADGAVTVLSVTHRINFIDQQNARDEIKQLESKRDEWKEKIAAEKILLNVYKQEEQVLIKNQDIKGEASTLKASELKEVADFQRTRLTEIYQKIRNAERNIEKLSIDEERFEDQLEEYNQKKEQPTSEILVSVDVKQSSTPSFTLSYLVRQASWYPAYDVRVTDITRPLTLQMKANIAQNSGEDWKDVKLALSTGNPNENGTKPVITPWRLYFLSHVERSLSGLVSGVQVTGFNGANKFVGRVIDEYGRPIVNASVTVKGANTGTTTISDGTFNIMAGPGNILSISSIGFETQEIKVQGGLSQIVLKGAAASLDEVVVTAYGIKNRRKKEDSDIEITTSYQPTTTIFEITEPYTVPNDGKTYTADIQNFELDAEYQYYSAPKLDPHAYLSARVTDWQELNLLPGDANLFFEGTFLGNSFLDVTNAGDTLSISLGRDKGVVVKRTLVKDYTSRKFLGSNKTDTRNFDITIRNNKSHSVNIVVEDQLPISTSKEIEVDKINTGTGTINDETKIVTWQATVESKKELKLPVGYTVKYPKEKNLQLD